MKRIIKNHCVDCYYYGKTCGFAKGRISSMLFRKGDSSKFCEMNFTWKDMIPDMLITFIPFVVGIIFLLIEFNYLLLLAIILILLFSSFGNGLIRGKLTCNYCKQREIGCPADKLINKK